MIFGKIGSVMLLVSMMLAIGSFYFVNVSYAEGAISVQPGDFTIDYNPFVHPYTIDPAIKNSTTYWPYLLVNKSSKKAKLDIINNSSLSVDEKNREVEFLNGLWAKYPIKLVNYDNYSLVTFDLNITNVTLTNSENQMLNTISSTGFTADGQSLNVQKANNGVQPQWAQPNHESIVEHAMKALGYSDDDARLAKDVSYDPDMWPPDDGLGQNPGFDVATWVQIVHSWDHYYNPNLGTGNATLEIVNCSNNAKSSFSTNHNEFIKNVGFSSHFLTDVGNPFHTGEEVIQILDYANNNTENLHTHYEVYATGGYHNVSDPNDPTFSAADASEAIDSVTKDQFITGDPATLTQSAASFSNVGLDGIILIMVSDPNWKRNEVLKNATKELFVQSTGYTIGLIKNLGYYNIKPHYIHGSQDGTLTDYQVQFIVHKGSGIDTDSDVYLNEGSQSWPNDFRFTNSNDELLSYWIESNNDTTAVVWVKVDSIAQSPAVTELKVFYGKANDPGESNGSATFVFFDDFSGSSLNSTGWSNRPSCAVVSGGVLNVTGNNAGNVLSSNTYGAGYAVEFRESITSTSGSDNAVGFCNSSPYFSPYSGAFNTWSSANWMYDGNYVNGNTGVPLTTGWTRFSSGRSSNGTSIGKINNSGYFVGRVASTPYSICVHHYGNGATRVDWVAVRKFTWNEPIRLMGTQTLPYIIETQTTMPDNTSNNTAINDNNTIIKPASV